MKKFLVVGLAIVGALAIVTVLLVGCVVSFSFFGASEEPLPSRVVLELDFEEGLVEGIPDDLVAVMMMEGVPTVRDVVEAIDRAAGDRRVEALVARIGGGGIGLAHLQELRDAVTRFRASGKSAYAFAETFGEFGPGNGGYYLASAFSEIWLQPSGDVGLTGLMYESPFVRGVLDHLDVEPDLDQRHEYKNAMNYYTHTEYTDAQREAMQAIVDSQFSQIVRGIADGRDLDEAEVRERFERGPFLGEEALEAGLVDRLGYRDELKQAIDEAVTRSATRVAALSYLGRAGRPHRRGTTVAWVHGYGAVVRGPSTYSPVDGSIQMGADTIARAMRRAVDDSRVRAILFRVDSPGGSYVASDTIWRETIRAREAGKPVIVSMGNLAGSGGYFVAMHADKIVAEPGTITGSIGVLGGKLVTAGFWDKVGVGWDSVQSSGNADMWSPRSPYDPTARERFQAGLDRVYDDFTTRVAEGRGLDLETVRRIARGRIWTGESALELGLVDALGGVDVALDLVRESLDLEANAPLRLKEFPRRRSELEMLADLYGIRGIEGRAAARGLRGLQPLVRKAVEVGLIGEDGGVLAMPPVPFRP